MLVIEERLLCSFATSSSLISGEVAQLPTPQVSERERDDLRYIYPYLHTRVTTTTVRFRESTYQSVV